MRMLRRRLPFVILVLLANVMDDRVSAFAPRDEGTKVVFVTPGDKATDVELDAVVQIHFSTGLSLSITVPLPCDWPIL